jgi:hypothetical protein
MDELRFQLGYGYLRLHLHTREDALKVVVLLRDCETGFFFDRNLKGPLVLQPRTLEHYSKITKLLKTEGYLHPDAL